MKTPILLFKRCFLKLRNILVIRMFSAVLLRKLALIALVLFAMLLTNPAFFLFQEQLRKDCMMLVLLLTVLVLYPVISSFLLVLMIVLILYLM